MTVLAAPVVQSMTQLERTASQLLHRDLIEVVNAHRPGPRIALSAIAELVLETCIQADVPALLDATGHRTWMRHLAARLDALAAAAPAEMRALAETLRDNRPSPAADTVSPEAPSGAPARSTPTVPPAPRGISAAIDRLIQDETAMPAVGARVDQAFVSALVASCTVDELVTFQHMVRTCLEDSHLAKDFVETHLGLIADAEALARQGRPS